MENLKKDNRTDKLLKDRGDSLRKNRQIKREKAKYEPDRGDSVRNKPFERFSESDKKSEVRHEMKQETSEVRREVKQETNDVKREVKQEKSEIRREPFKRQNEFDKEVIRLLDRRRRIRDEYTIKNYILPEVNKHIKNDIAINNKDISINNQKNTEAKDKIDVINSTKRDKEKATKIPIIRTITSKNDAKVYKAVTFKAPKQNTVTPLQINIPTTTINKTKIPKLINQNKIKTTSKTSVKYNSGRKRTSERKSKRWQKRHVSSPVLIKDGDSPPTEVAKWAPSCINKHTKPYYEAWVNTTLAAISKTSKNNKFVDDRNSIWTFRKGLERTESPDLVYKDYKDERYTGRIKVNHKWRK